MQWFDAIMTFLTAGGFGAGLFVTSNLKDKRRHEERMAESERRHDRFMQQLKAVSNAKSQSAIQRIKEIPNAWHDWEV